MPTYYTLDRTNQCSPGQTFSYQMTSPNNWLQNDDGSPMQFPVSRHGNYYLNSPLVNNPNSTSVAIEFIFELIRRHHFPEKTTRFCCMFASESIEGIDTFIRRIGWNTPCQIFNLEYTGQVHRGDMNLLNITGNMWQVERNAMAYWCGETYELRPGYQPFWEILIPLPVQLGELVAQITP
ncbi:DUF2441 domain-containing protein [Salmonella enterica subsp. enterica serovar Llandoff]|nr:DUF2441 domain-containing protein [Salmonella enterica subsp. enterica serovar Llandoff]EJN2898429.1 DUF2441 domain-containing protein [Salmonella enterica subsp. enterica serovar Monschaui]EKQ9067820.1 DUF2441 domain-containing protein [Salmonella enterica]